MIKKTLSIIIPAYNEEKNIRPLYNSVLNVVQTLKISYEIIFIDDGSTDNTFDQINQLPTLEDNSVRCIRLRRNFGKSIALTSGFGEALGDIVITMDADLQDDPKEISNLINKINEGWDVVSGWKYKRKDPLEKRLASKVFNSVVSRISGIKLHDFNCGLKAYKNEVIKKISIYGGHHRFIPIIAHSYGFKVCELKVSHHQRKYGSSKYGFGRYLSGMFDIFTIFFLMFFQRRPLHFIGIMGLFPFTIGWLLILYVAVMKFLFYQTGNRPSLTAGVFFVGISFQIFFFGLISELIIHIHMKSNFSPSDYQSMNILINAEIKENK